MEYVLLNYIEMSSALSVVGGWKTGTALQGSTRGNQSVVEYDSNKTLYNLTI